MCKVIERHLEGLRLAKRQFGEVKVGRKHTIENHAPDPRREELGVHRAQIRSIRLAEVVERGVANDRAHDVEVASGIHRAHEPHDRISLLLAGEGRLLRGRHDERLLIGRIRRRVDSNQLVNLGIAEAPDRVALLNSARVDPDNVIGLVHGRAHNQRRRLRVIEGAAPRTSWVHEQGADRLAGGPHSRHRELQGAAPRVRVVQRHLHGRAVGIAAVLPGHLLPVEHVKAGGRRRRDARYGDGRDLNRRRSTAGREHKGHGTGQEQSRG